MCKKLFFFLLIPALATSQVQIGQDIDGEAAGDNCGIHYLRMVIL